MKKIITLLIFSFTIFNCGSDGHDGDAYLAYAWDWYVDSYWDNNPGTSGVTEYVDYKVSPGSYDFEYYCSDGAGNNWYFEGTYRITIEKGESGGLFVTGDDGEDNYFLLYMDGISGPDFDQYKIGLTAKKEILNEPAIDLSLYNAIPFGDKILKVQYSSSGKMTIEGQWYKLVLK